MKSVAGIIFVYIGVALLLFRPGSRRRRGFLPPAPAAMGTTTQRNLAKAATDLGGARQSCSERQEHSPARRFGSSGPKTQTRRVSPLERIPRRRNVLDGPGIVRSSLSSQSVDALDRAAGARLRLVRRASHRHRLHLDVLAVTSARSLAAGRLLGWTRLRAHRSAGRSISLLHDVFTPRPGSRDCWPACTVSPIDPVGPAHWPFHRGSP